MRKLGSWKQPLPTASNSAVTFQESARRLLNSTSLLVPQSLPPFSARSTPLERLSLLFTEWDGYRLLSPTCYDPVTSDLRAVITATSLAALTYIGFDGVTTLADEAYVDLFGKPGEFQTELKVYGRTGLPCRRCRTPIQSVKISGRSAYFCPQCQS